VILNLSNVTEDGSADVARQKMAAAGFQQRQEDCLAASQPVQFIPRCLTQIIAQVARNAAGRRPIAKQEKFFSLLQYIMTPRPAVQHF
jgi:hypothetical protein